MKTKKKISGRALFSKEFPTYTLTGKWGEALGSPERNGAWIIWGAEKNGKTTLALMLAEYLTGVAPTGYISGEEGIGGNFKVACIRAGIEKNTKLAFYPYMPLTELDDYLTGKRREKIIVLDNLTVYNEELKYGGFLKLLQKHPDKLFIFLAHEEKGQPYTSSAKLCSRYAKVKIHVDGLKATIGGRCPGGEVLIDEEKAALIWGNDIKEPSNNQ